MIFRAPLAIDAWNVGIVVMVVFQFMCFRGTNSFQNPKKQNHQSNVYLKWFQTQLFQKDVSKHKYFKPLGVPSNLVHNVSPLQMLPPRIPAPTSGNSRSFVPLAPPKRPVFTGEQHGFCGLSNCENNHGLSFLRVTMIWFPYCIFLGSLQLLCTDQYAIQGDQKLENWDQIGSQALQCTYRLDRAANSHNCAPQVLGVSFSSQLKSFRIS